VEDIFISLGMLVSFFFLDFIFYMNLGCYRIEAGLGLIEGRKI